MAYRQTYASVKDTIGLPIGYCGGDEALMQQVNEASLLLWNSGDYVGKFARFKLRVSQNACGNRIITWPNEVETIESLEICGQPIGVRNLYFEFISMATGSFDRRGGYGPQSYGYGWGNGGYSLLGDRQEVCCFEDINPGAKVIKAYSYLTDDDGTQIIILGYDDNGNWIRTKQNNIWVDGEYLTLSAAEPPSTVNFFSSITGIQFSVTPRNGDVTITQVDTTNTTPEKFLSTYSYDEEIPVYRRSILTGFNFNQGPQSPGNPPQQQCAPTLTALCRLRFIPIQSDTDYMQIGNISALTEMLISLQKRSNGKVQDAEEFRSRAMRAMDEELKQFQGMAPRKIVSVINRGLWGASYNLR